MEQQNLGIRLENSGADHPEIRRWATKLHPEEDDRVALGGCSKVAMGPDFYGFLGLRAKVLGQDTSPL